MTEHVTDASLDLLARQNGAIEQLTRTAELLQQQVDALRRRVAALEGVPWPNQEPPETE
jgi:hypothetical protein